MTQIEDPKSEKPSPYPFRAFRPSSNHWSHWLAAILLLAVGTVFTVWLLRAAFSKEDIFFDLESPRVKGQQDANIGGAAIRDSERTRHIQEIQRSLESYKTQKGFYPEKLDDLVVEGIVKEVPKNPTPGGMEYSYTPIGSLPTEYYDLVFSLEVGVEGYGVGENVVNPEFQEETESIRGDEED